MSFNVHGHESVEYEAAILPFYTLAKSCQSNPKNAKKTSGYHCIQQSTRTVASLFQLYNNENVNTYAFSQIYNPWR